MSKPIIDKLINNVNIYCSTSTCTCNALKLEFTNWELDIKNNCHFLQRDTIDLCIKLQLSEFRTIKHKVCWKSRPVQAAQGFFTHPAASPATRTIIHPNNPPMSFRRINRIIQSINIILHEVSARNVHIRS